MTNPALPGIEIRPIVRCAQLEQLLDTCHLPASDLASSQTLQLFGAFAGADLAGAVGLEVYSSVALLRSLAVAPEQRHKGLGGRLVKFAEEHAEAQGVAAIYLLTTTAAPFFEKRGYRVAARADAPDAIRATAQFSGLCPASSTFMVKRRTT
ncbi:arsenic resistance N-acetyltransferase ArsN2 [Herbaspirillum sp. ST 5-3]|uniref:arsenic resistance N-acetyltransferase ArsN2 n=1 Tax=Oxalobacteraceae TaxID=75682 RepID=UPI0010A4D0FB|nr:arsenic resistance N-acetyltransferase ArsN2 [Herbaspirillum sp. ST 5-3]